MHVIVSVAIVTTLGMVKWLLVTLFVQTLPFNVDASIAQ